jgi:hypothetical protein
MARHHRLTRSWIVRLLALGAGVLLVHALLLDWFARHHVQSSVLKPMVAPMYTRVLTPQAPPAPAPAPAAVARAVPRPAPAVRTVPKPERAAAPAPQPVPEPEQDPSPSTSDTGTSTVAQAEPPASGDAAPAPVPAPESADAAGAASAPQPPGAEPSTDPIERWPRDTRLSYRLTGNYRGELHGDARVLWQRDGTRYQVRVEADVGLLASLVLTSQGEIAAEGLMPSAFEELRNGKSRSVRFGEREVMLLNGDILPRPPGVQDTASQFVELSQRFATGREALEVGRAISFWMARPGAVDLWTYDVVKRETLTTGKLGEVEAFHLKPRPLANPRGNITAEMWFAPSLQYLPVRIRVNMGTEAHIDLLVETIEQR